MTTQATGPSQLPFPFLVLFYSQLFKRLMLKSRLLLPHIWLSLSLQSEFCLYLPLKVLFQDHLPPNPKNFLCPSSLTFHPHKTKFQHHLTLMTIPPFTKYPPFLVSMKLNSPGFLPLSLVSALFSLRTHPLPLVRLVLTCLCRWLWF